MHCAMFIFGRILSKDIRSMSILNLQRNPFNGYKYDLVRASYTDQCKSASNIILLNKTVENKV
jgi:hypothetical protein